MKKVKELVGLLVSASTPLISLISFTLVILSIVTDFGRTKTFSYIIVGMSLICAFRWYVFINTGHTELWFRKLIVLGTIPGWIGLAILYTIIGYWS